MDLLSDLKILDFTTLLPGPYATWILADMGARVLKISAPNKKDLVLESGPKTEGGLSANRAWLNHQKTEVFLDLKTKEGQEEIFRLIKEEGYNCIIEQFRPGVMDRLGLSYDKVREVSKDMVYLSLSGYGQDSPYRDKGGHDINYLALSGIMSYSGRKDQGPVLYGCQIGDLAAAQNAVIGILAAHNKRKLTGEGTYVDVSILDSLLPYNTMAGAATLFGADEPGREEDWLNGGSLYDFYKTSDGKFISLGALEPKFFKAFCQVMGHEDWIDAGCVCKDAEEKKAILRKEFKEKTRDQWVKVFEGVDACLEPVLSLNEALVHSQHARTRGAIRSIETEGDEVLVYGNPIKFEE